MSVSLKGQGPAVLLPGLLRLLRPLVRLLIQRGVTFPILAELLRDLYIDVTRTEVLRDPQARTDSRITLLTGIHRKEIRRQRIRPEGVTSEPDSLGLSSQIIARWLAAGPQPLPRPAFDALVASVTRDLRPRAVLDEWLSQGVVRLDEQDRVTLNARAYLPQPGSAAQLQYFARNLHDHIAAAAANITASGAPPFLDRSVHYDALTPDIADRLIAAGRQEAERLLLAINARALAMLEAETPPAGTTRRVNLGVYLYAEDEPGRGDSA